jgi:hypothetical protein
MEAELTFGAAEEEEPPAVARAREELEAAVSDDG